MALISCPDCGKQISDKAPACPKCGRPAGLPLEEPSLDENAVKLVQLTCVARDVNHVYWDEESVAAVQRWFHEHYGGVPSFDRFYNVYGRKSVDQVAKQFIEERHVELEAYRQINGDSSCHACGSRDGLTHYPFGMARILSTKWDWTETVLSIGVSAVTLPWLGIGGLYGPSRSRTAQIIRLQLVLCRRCADQRKGFFGKVKLSVKDYALHPWFEHVRSLSYAKVLTPEELAQYKPVG